MPTTPYQYNVSPSPTSGIGPFGLVPGQIGLPSPSSDLSAQIPGLSALNTSAANTIASKLSGSLSPATIKALQDASARFGVRSGMPGSGLQLNNLFGNIAGFAEGQAEQGLQDYSRFVPTVSGTQTVPPALQTSVAQSNAQLGAAPSPGASQLYAQQLFDQYLQKMRGPGGGTGGPIAPTAGTGHGCAGFDRRRVPVQSAGHRRTQSKCDGHHVLEYARDTRLGPDAQQHVSRAGWGHTRAASIPWNQPVGPCEWHWRWRHGGGGGSVAGQWNAVRFPE